MKILSYMKGVVCILLLLISNSVFADWTEISSDIEISKSRPAFDRVNRVYFVYLDIKNTGGSAVNGPFRVLVDNSTIPVTNQSGNTESDVPFIDIANESIIENGSARVRVDFLAQRKALAFDAIVQANEIDLTGRFLDSAVEGLRYETSSGIVNFTNSLGEYDYKNGDTVEFFIGDVSLGKTVAEGILTTNNFPYSSQVAQFLQTLDQDSILDNGIQIVRNLHDNPLFKKGTKKADDAAAFEKNLDIKDFSNNDDNTVFISEVTEKSGLSSRNIVSKKIAFDHQQKSEKLKRIKENSPEFYSYIEGSFSNSKPNLPENSNIHKMLASRLSYYFYNKVYKSELDYKVDMHFNAMRDIETTQKDINDFANSYLNIVGLVTEVSIYATDIITGISDNDLRKDTKRRVVNAVITSGKSEAVSLVFDETGKEMLSVIESCLVNIPWPTSISSLIGAAAKQGSKVVDCAMGETVKATGRFVNSYKGGVSLQEWEYYAIAKAYLDAYFKCGYFNNACMSSQLGGKQTLDEQLQYIMEENQLDIGIDWSVRQGAKIVIDEYIATISKLTNTISELLPSDSFFNYQYGNRDTTSLAAEVEPLKLSSDDKDVLWVNVDLDNLSGRDIVISSIHLKFLIGNEEFSFFSDLNEEWSRDIFNVTFLAFSKVEDIRLPIYFYNNKLPEEGLARLVMTINYISKDGVISNNIQRVRDLDLAEIRNSTKIDQLDAKLILLGGNIDTADEEEKYYLPSVSLGGLVVSDAVDIKWEVNAYSLGSSSVSVNVDANGFYIVVPFLKDGYSSDVITLNAYVNSSPYSEPAIFALNVAKKPLDKESSIILPDGDIGVGWIDLPAYGSLASSYLGVSAFANRSGGDGDFQCTELIKRFYNLLFDINKNTKSHGKNVALNYGGEEGVYNNQAIIVDYHKNELSKRLPSNGSIVSFSGGEYGHVAIVKKVERINDNKYKVYLFEQNWIWIEGEKISHSRAIEFTRNDKGYWSSIVDASKGRHVIGWTTLRLAGENQPPIANAGEDIFVSFGEHAKLDGSASADDGVIEKYEWLEDDIVVAEAQIFSTPNLSVGMHDFTLRVTDNFGEKATDTVGVVVYDNQSDADNDGMPDKWEVTYGLEPLADDSSLDFDGDGRSNLQELKDGTDPNTYDEYQAIADLERGLVAYYPFDGDAYDSSGNGNDGIAYGGVTYVEGIKGLSASFDGIDDHVLVNDNPNIDFNNTKSFALTAWIKPDVGYGIEEDGHIDIVSKWGAAGDAAYLLGINSSGKILAYTHSGHASSMLATTPSITSESWSYVSLVFNSSRLSIYINGVLSTYIDNPEMPIDSIYNLVIGEEPVGGNNFKGKVDELRIYDRVITSDEVAELYARDSSSEFLMNKVTDLNGNHRHWCAIANNEVTCWGEIYKYKEDEFLSTFVNPKQVSHGRNHVCVLDDRGVECWGWDYYGVLDVPALSNPTYLSSGEQHVCAIDDTGVVCWGKNDYGQTDVPVSLENPKQVSAGALNTCALDDTGVVCWGWDYIVNQQVDDISNPERVILSQGAARICVSDTSNLSCWGSEAPTAFPEFNNITHLGQYDYFGYCLIDNNEVVCWDTLGVYKPSVSNPTVASYTDGTFCVGDEEGVRCWGRNNYGQLEVPAELKFNNAASNSGFSDNFDTLNKENWYVTRMYGPNGPHWKNGVADYDSVSIHDGVITLLMDKTDDGPIMYSKPLSVPEHDYIKIKRRVFSHPNNQYYSGGFSIYSTDSDQVDADKKTALCTISHLDYHYQGHWNTFVLNDRTDESNWISPIWNQWFEEELTYYPKTGDAWYRVGNQTVHSLCKPNDGDFLKVRIQSYGWWTGHYEKMDNIEISTIRP